MTQMISCRFRQTWFSAVRAVALLVVFGLCCGGGSVYAQFTAVNSITGLPDGAVASLSSDTAVGVNSIASAGMSTALGAFAEATGNASTAVGLDAEASGVASTALGRWSVASEFSSTALGHTANATGEDSTAVGYTAWASGETSTAVGAYATTPFFGSTAIGYGAATTRADQMMFGSASNTYTAPGITSDASRAAQTGPREIVTTDASGNLASDTLTGLGLASQQDVGRNTEGVAMAMALSGVPTVLPRGTNYAVSTNWGGFAGENAIAVGGSARLTDNLFLNGGGAIGTNQGNGGGRAGMTFAW